MTYRLPAIQLFYDKKFVADIPINHSSFTVGRKAGCHLRLIDSSISREHFRILVSNDGEFTLEDLSSTNGTFLNHQRVMKHLLREGDSVNAGRCTLIFHTFDSAMLPSTDASSWRTSFSRRNEQVRFSKPKGQFVLLKDDHFVEFNAVSFAMVRDEEAAADDEKPIEGFLRRLPRLQVVASDDPKDDEVTKFSVSDSSLGNTAKIQLRAKPDLSLIFEQPHVKARRIRIPWKVIERVVVPISIAGSLVAIGTFLLPRLINAELQRAEKHWDEGLSKIAQRYRYADDSVFSSPGAASPMVSQPNRRTEPLPVEEVWKRIDSRPDLRNYLLFEVLDEVLSAEDLSWSLDKLLQNLSKMQSITDRLPSVRKLEIVMTAVTPAIDMKGIRPGNIVFLRERAAAAAASTPSYSAYKGSLTAQLSQVSECSDQRHGTGAVKVVMGFTVGGEGSVKSVFVNQAKVTQDQDLLSCIKSRLLSLKLPPPPGGSISILYTFQFAAPTKVTF